MPLVGLKSSFFDALEAAMVLPSFEFDFIDDLDALAEGSIAGPQTVLQLSSTVIRISQPLWGVFQPIDYEFK